MMHAFSTVALDKSTENATGQLTELLRAAILLFLPVLLMLAMSPPASAQVNLPSLGDSMAGTISTQEEYEYGRELLRSIRRETRTLDDPLIEEYVANLTYRLAAHSELTDRRLAFVVIDSEALNAFAAPGGVIGVNAGLFQFAGNEGEFASVLAHELAHLSQRHFARRNEMARNNALPNLATMLASIVVAATVGGDAGQAAIMGSQAAAMDQQLRYSRNNEQEADRIGIRTLQDAGFDPDDMAGMFERMLRSSSFSQRPPEFLSTHPLSESRVADSRNRAASYPPVDTEEYNIEFLLMKQRVNVHTARNLETLIVQGQQQLPRLRGKEADSLRYGIALAQLRSERPSEARETLGPLLEKDPRRITYVTLQAEIALAERNLDQALGILSDNLRINPGNHPLTMEYASALEEAGQFQEAASLLRKHAETRRNDSNLWYELAEVQGLADNIVQVHLARAEYFFTIGDFGRVHEHFERARSEEDDPVAEARIRQRQAEIRAIQSRFYR